MCVCYDSPYQVMGSKQSRDAMELLQGTLDVLILRALGAGPAHGYAVSRWVRERTSGSLCIEDAPLYKALHRLEHAGCVDAEWGVSENNRRARYYRLTPKGRRRLRAETLAWQQYPSAVSSVLAPD
jgi:PadR family transcriptional regulator, regulatory protein PadR